MKKSSFAAAVALALVLAGCSGNGPDENIALNKTAYASSTYDYNLTAQLVTDGIIESGEPAWLKVSTPEGELPRREKEWTVDAGPYSRNTLEGYSTFLEYEWGRQSFTASCVRIRGYVVYQKPSSEWSISCRASGSGTDFREVGFIGGSDLTEIRPGA